METLSVKLTVEADGHLLTECPRWHRGELYFSDILGRAVYKLNGTAVATKVMATTDRPGGLGFMPNGDMLVVQMHDTKIVRRSADGQVSEHADLSGVARFGINDMVVDHAGRAYVSQFGYNAHDDAAPVVPSPIIIVEPDGAVRTAAQGVKVANGLILTPDGKTLICAECRGAQISTFDVSSDGTLSNHRIFAKLPGYVPDGICLDEGGGVWAACCLGGGFIRVLEGGTITHQVPMPHGRFAYACMLGGPDRRTLYMCTAESYLDSVAITRKSARIESIPVVISGVGLP